MKFSLCYIVLENSFVRQIYKMRFYVVGFNHDKISKPISNSKSSCLMKCFSNLIRGCKTRNIYCILDTSLSIDTTRDKPPRIKGFFSKVRCAGRTKQNIKYDNDLLVPCRKN